MAEASGIVTTRRQPPRRYDLVTETTGIEVTEEGASMIATRYELAASYGRGRRVLELGCGAGLGFDLLGRDAALVVGADYSAELLGSAQQQYGSKFPLIRLSAENLPFDAGAFDVVVCFEMSYYIRDARQAFAEVHRVLAPGGVVLFANANPERPDFIRSPYSTHYHTGDEFRAELSRVGFSVNVHGAFPVSAASDKRSLMTAVLPVARRILEALRLVPRTIEGRARLKRLIFGSLRRLPATLPPNFAPVATRAPVPPGAIRDYKVLFVTGTKTSLPPKKLAP